MNGSPLIVETLVALCSSERSPRTAQQVAESGARMWRPFLPSLSTFRSGPRRQESAPPRASRAPLTAPGRCRQRSLCMREGRRELQVLFLLNLERLTQVPDGNA
jgi:hypothetical protein